MVSLFPHQKQALEMTSSQNRVAYWLDMGLGKTFVGSEKMRELGAKVNLVICQKSKIQDWCDHFNVNYQCEVVDLTTLKIDKFESFIHLCEVIPHTIVGIINYDLIFRRPALAKLRDFTLILDESSLVQNETSKRSKFILKRLKPENVILLSGTPTGGKYEKLWSQCQLLGWNISKTAFWNTYVKYHFEDFDGFPVKIIDGYKNVERLKRKLREQGAVFMKSNEVFDLPQQIDTNLHCTVSKEYRKFHKDAIVKFDNQEFVGDTSLTKMLYERMLCGFANKEKLNLFKDLLSSTDDRLIVFYNFQNELMKLSEIVIDSDRPLSIVNGDTKDLSAYENFENSVTLIQYQAGAMGLNLQKSNKIVYFTPPLSSELFEQSKKRTHRIGQERTCFYYYLICKNSIETKIYSALKMRRDYTERLFENVE
nr:MAG TPA: Chromatin remodeling complex ATPase [Caudoviricetes sp.]